MENIYQVRIARLREMMARGGWDAVVIGGSDPHSSEYPADRWKQVQWLSGFTGEAGDLVITADHAGLWTDTRYFIQALAQLDGTGVQLHKTRVPEQVLIPEWLATQAFPGRNTVSIAVDGLCQRVSDIRALKAAFDEDTEVHIVSVPDLLDDLWEDRPAIPATEAYEVPEEVVGEGRASKLARLRGFLAAQGCDAALLSALDEIAWLLNVRASDIVYNPMAISYLLVSRDEVRWFVRKGRQTVPALPDVEVLPYDDLPVSLAEGFGRLFVDPDTLNYHIFNLLDPESTVCGTSPVGLWKAVKNPVEIEGMREAHLEDGLAMEQFFWWLETSLEAGEPVSEWDAACKLGTLRAAIPGYRGDSFETISAYGPGAALPHYITPQENAPQLHPHGLYLCDSGGQYLFGTTDITRTVPLGSCSDLEMEDYTLVLKGHIDLAMAIFPAGTAGCQIDALAREPLWRAKRSFGHGTGHGVGFFLGVHEGPQDIRQNFNRQPLLPGMICSDEPGIYREGMHGVRHENLILCREAGENEFGRWLEFETLTLCHIDTSAVLKELLTADEVRWLNAYNERVFRTLAPRLPAEIALWLRDKTEAI